MVFPRGSRLLLAALVLLANLATPDLVCAEHGPDDGPALAEQAEHHDMSGHEDESSAPSDLPDQPVIPTCCPVLMSCSISLDAGQSCTTAECAGPATTPSSRWTGHLLSRSTTPEPPPPKV